MTLHYNGINNFFSAKGDKFYQFKAKNSEISAFLLCLGNISKDVSIDNMKKTIWICVWFSVDYDSIAVYDMLGVQKYLMTKHGIKQCWDLLKIYLLDYYVLENS